MTKAGQTAGDVAGVSGRRPAGAGRDCRLSRPQLRRREGERQQGYGQGNRYRSKEGGFKSLDALKKVPGIDAAKIESLKIASISRGSRLTVVNWSQRQPPCPLPDSTKTSTPAAALRSTNSKYVRRSKQRTLQELW